MTIYTQTLQAREDIGFLPYGLDEPYRVFISEDPKGFESDEVNLYLYAGNNPILFFDPYGEDKFTNALGVMSYIGNTVGLVYKPAKGIAIAAAVTNIIYSSYQYNAGKMSGKETATNIAFATAGIANFGISKIDNAIARGVSAVVGAKLRAAGVARTAMGIAKTFK